METANDDDDNNEQAASEAHSTKLSRWCRCRGEQKEVKSTKEALAVLQAQAHLCDR